MTFVRNLACIDNNVPTIVGGDFNVNMLTSSEEQNTLLRFMTDLNFKQVIQKPTHQLGGLLDHVWISANTILKNQLQTASAYSDHR